MTNLTNQSSVEMNKYLSIAITDIFNRASSNEPTRTLTSCEDVIRTVRFLDDKHQKKTVLQRFRHQGLMRKLLNCQLLEKKVSVYDLKDTTPEGFLELIKNHVDIGFNAIMQKKRNNKIELQTFIDNKEKEIAPEQIQNFTKRLEQVIATHEDYLYVEETQGFFCEEVLTAYYAHLVKSFNDNFFKDSESESLEKAKVFTVEGVVQ